MESLQPLQELLGFVHCKNPAFKGPLSPGRVGFVGLLFGLLLSSSLFTFVCSTILLCLPPPLLAPVFHPLLQSLLPSLQQFSLYASLLSLFHVLEFVATALYTPHACSATSFLLDHSPAYTFAALFSWSEYALRCLLPHLPLTRSYFSPPHLSLVPYLGLSLVLGGQLLRFAAMRTCGVSFNHMIQESQLPSHRLVTSGVYSVFRHPAYVGWFYWSVGTQLLLGNPLSSLAYCYASVSFFRARIPHEEATLLKQYGDGVYERYAASTFIAIPGVKGLPRGKAKTK